MVTSLAGIAVDPGKGRPAALLAKSFVNAVAHMGDEAGMSGWSATLCGALTGSRDIK